MRPLGPLKVPADVQVHEPSGFLQKWVANSSTPGGRCRLRAGRVEIVHVDPSRAAVTERLRDFPDRSDFAAGSGPLQSCTNNTEVGSDSQEGSWRSRAAEGAHPRRGRRARDPRAPAPAFAERGPRGGRGAGRPGGGKDDPCQGVAHRPPHRRRAHALHERHRLRGCGDRRHDAAASADHPHHRA